MGSNHSQQTYHGACGLKSAVQGCGRQLDQSEFRLMTEVSFPILVGTANVKRRETSVSREIQDIQEINISSKTQS